MCIHTVVPALKRFGLVQSDTAWRQTVNQRFNTRCRDYNMKRHCVEERKRERGHRHAGLVVCRCVLVFRRVL